MTTVIPNYLFTYKWDNIDNNALYTTCINVEDDQFTFCEVCENNIERWYNDTDPERLPMWTDWKVSQ